MEQNLTVAAKKVWSLVHLMLFIIRKNISRTKLLLDLNLMIKRGKIARKALQNLMLHRWASAFKIRSHKSSDFTFPPPQHEINCTNSPVYSLSLFATDKKSTINDDHDQIFVDPVVIKALEMLTSATTSPAVPGFGKSPMVRQLRITDSPFPLTNEEEDSYVDEAAEKFIMKFYNNLKRQN